MDGSHNDILFLSPVQVWDHGKAKAVVLQTEYRADGCVTWREADQ